MSDDILVWDLEVTPNVGLFWSAGYKITIPPHCIVKERQICCIGYRWLHQKRTYCINWEGETDAYAIEKFLPILHSARFSVAHNGRGFDERWLRGRAMKHRIPMSPDVQMYDTLQKFKKFTYLNSNKLDYIGAYLDLGRKIQTSYDLWTNITLYDHQASLKEMARYCRRDVDLLADVFEYSRSYFPAVDSIAPSILHCPYCGQETLAEHKRRLTVQRGQRVQLQCTRPKCAQYHTVSAGKYDKAKSRAAA